MSSPSIDDTPPHMSADTLVVGAGPGGLAAAMELARGGQRVVLVEAGQGLGGGSLFEGCVPASLLCETAHRLRDIHRAPALGIEIPGPWIRLDPWRSQAHVQETLLQIAADNLRAAQALGIQVVFGQARLRDAHNAEIARREGGQSQVQFSRAILATGSHPVRPPLHGIDLPQVLTADEVPAMTCLPRHLSIIGGGPAGVEMAQVFRAFDCDVTLIEGDPRLLPRMDEELVLMLTQHLINEGIELILGAHVKTLCHTGGDGLFVQYDAADGGCEQVYADRVLLATGRRPRLDGLGLEDLGVQYDARGVHVDQTLQTSLPGLYAVGDLSGPPMLANWAAAQGRALADHLLGRPARFPDLRANAAAVFSRPALAVAGQSESEAKAAGHRVGCLRQPMQSNLRARIAGQRDGRLKLIYDLDDRRLLGVQMLADGADDVIGEAALAIAGGLTLDDLANTLHPNPSLGEALTEAARAALFAGGNGK